MKNKKILENLNEELDNMLASITPDSLDSKIDSAFNNAQQDEELSVKMPLNDLIDELSEISGSGQETISLFELKTILNNNQEELDFDSEAGEEK